MAGSVKFILDADSAKAVQGFLKIVDAQKKVQQGHKEGIHDAHEHEGAIAKLKDAAHELVAEYLTYETAREIWENIGEEIHHAYEEMIKFNKESKGVATLGANLNNIPGARQRLLDLSEQFGIPREQLQPFLTNAEIKLSNLPAKERDEFERQALETYEATGQSPQAAFDAARALRETFPGISVPEAYNWVEFGRQKGGMSAEDQASMLPGILPAFSDLGIDIKDFEAVVATMSRMGGKDSAMGKGIIESLNKLPAAVESGHIRAGVGWEGVLEDVQKYHDEDLVNFQKDFGKRGAPAIYAMAAHRELFKSALSEEGAFPANKIGQIGEALENDPQAKAALEAEKMEVIKANEQLHLTQKEIDVLSGWEKRQMEARQRLPVAFKWAGVGLAALDELFTLGADERSPLATVANAKLSAKANAPGELKTEAHNLRSEINERLMTGEYPGAGTLAGSDLQSRVGQLMREANRRQDERDLEGAVGTLRGASSLLEGGGGGGGQNNAALAVIRQVASILHPAATNLHAASQNILAATKAAHRNNHQRD